MFKKPGGKLLAAIIISCVALLIAINVYLFTDTGGQSGTLAGFEEEGDYYNQYPDYSFGDMLDSVGGRVPILMYHMIDTPYMDREIFGKGVIRRAPWMDRFIVKSSEFREELESLYSAGFRNISLNEFISLQKGQIKTLDRIPPGSKLYVLTFDDGPYGQFDYKGVDKNGNPVIDPDCAVGIMMDFARIHPDFKLNAAFAITFEHAPFMQPQYVKDKLNRLLDLGFEIVNHTATHKKLSWFVLHDKQTACFEIGRAMEMFESYLGYRAATIDKVCYPDGSVNPEVWKFIPDVTFNERTYHFIAGLDAKGMQAKNPNDRKFNIYNIARIETSGATFGKFVLGASNLYTTPSIRDRKETWDLAFYQSAENKKKHDMKEAKTVRQRR